MANLLVIENWVEGTGRLLPELLLKLGHDYTFVTRSPEHYQASVSVKNDVPIHPIVQYASEVIETETNDVAGLIERLRPHHQARPFDGVLTICDYYIGTVAQVARALGLPQAFSSNVDSIRCKQVVRQAIQDAGLPNARFAVTTCWQQTQIEAQKIGYPLIIKPSDLASSAFVRRVHTEQELREAFLALEAFTHNFRAQLREPVWLLEEWLSGPEVSVEAYTYQGQTTVIGITDKSLTGQPYFIEDGHMFPADIEPRLSQDITDYVVQVLHAVGQDHGISHTEVKLTPDGPRIVEINPRPGGNYIAELIERVTGINLLKVHIDLALGRKPNVLGLDRAQGSAAVKFLVPDKQGMIASVDGLDALTDNAAIVRWHMKPLVGTIVSQPVDNACYLGHVIAYDAQGRQARRFAEAAIGAIHLDYAATAMA